MLPIVKDIEEQALNIQYMTHGLAKWLDNTARRLESIKEQCLREIDELNDLDQDLQANNCPLQQQEKTYENFNYKNFPNFPNFNIIQQEQFQKQEQQQIQSENDSDKVSQKLQKQQNVIDKRKKKLTKKQQKKKEKNQQTQSLGHLTCQICFSNYKEIEKFENHMKKFHKIQDFTFNNDYQQNSKQIINQECINKDIALDQNFKVQQNANNDIQKINHAQLQ